MEVSMNSQQALELKGVQMANNQQKLVGQASLQLLQSAAVEMTVSPSTPSAAVGQNINTTA
ncbi:hypothetical protein [Aliidiomarina maris]|uniref:Uncharacterized protein n=1 Tax=Aliidiomarina maris TaxID=531312 RepID=A0A327WY73_9GAMM|nr:hypothetical protein [Aliidiomarina maris]MBA3988754.1 hypothetical protein [Idiomarina sp.]MCL5050165.1 hypothetical protein [Bacillota bacterium]RAJ98257.1 hypothetical protein B0I24_1057 [Aliidiomarina maris]RUO24909.1 hypothetical protein CWE07_07680 [Aliidiomarina maris]